jgi:hypothetical protein
MLLSRHQNAGQNHYIKIANRFFENVAHFRYLGTATINQSLFQKKIKRRLNSDNACYYSAQNLLSSRLLSKNIKIKMHKTIILPVVLYGCETWSLTLKLFEPKRDEVTGGWRKLHNEELHSLYSSPSTGRTKKNIRLSNLYI